MNITDVIMMAKLVPEEKLVTDFLLGLKKYKAGEEAEPPHLPVFLLLLKWTTKDMSMLEIMSMLSEEEPTKPETDPIEDEILTIFRTLFGGE